MAGPITWHGSIPLEAVPYEIEFDEFGIASSTMHLQYRFQSPGAAASQIAGITIHPAFSWLKRSKAKIQRQEADFASATITFEGVPPNTDETTYKLKASLATEDIETHPKFQEWVDEGVAVLDDKNKLDYFSDDPNLEDTLNGIESWMVPNLIYEETWVRGQSGGARDFSKLGKKESPPPSPARPSGFGSDRDYLFLGGDIEIIGFGSKMTRRWRLSGPRGWNERVYG